VDLAESIITELSSLQKKNEELVTIIQKLEYESDIIINQFEEKIAELHKKIKKSEDNAIKSEKKYENLFHENEHEKAQLVEQYHNLEATLNEKIRISDEALNETKSSLKEKDLNIAKISEEIKKLQDTYSHETTALKSEIESYHLNLKKEKEIAISKQKNLISKYENSIRKIQEECLKKDNELRILASEINNNNLLKEKEILDLKGKLLLAEQSVSDKIREIKSEKSVRNKIEEENKNIIEKNNKIKQKYEDRLTELENRIFSQKEDLVIQKETLEKKIKDLLDTIDKDSREITRLNESNIEINKEYQKVSTLLKENESENTKLKSDYEEDLNKYKIRYDDLDEHLKKTKSQLIEKEEKIRYLDTRCIELDKKADTDGKKNSVLINNLEDQKRELQDQLNLRILQNEEEKSVLSMKVMKLKTELDEISNLKEEREIFYLSKIEQKDNELHINKEEIKKLQDFYTGEISEKDRKLSLISCNNETLRTEVERIRSRLLLLEKTIREEKDEPVQALLRQIQNLSVKLTGIESEKLILTDRVLKLDTENTRLSKIISALPEYEDKQIKKPENNSEEKMLSFPPNLLILLPLLEDPNNSMEAALEISGMGNNIVDFLIPLLYRGSLERRAWIATILYEINDSRTIKPLTDITESQDTHLRELIWDTRVKFREWKRSGTVGIPS